MKQRSLLLVSLVALLTMGVYAQPQTELKGDWKMDASRSHFFGPRGAPASVLISFVQDGNLLRETLTVLNDSGRSIQTITYDLDGSERTNGSGPELIKSKIIRSGDALVLQWQDEGGTYSRRLIFSADHRTLTIKVADSDPDGEPADVIVLVRQ